MLTELSSLKTSLSIPDYDVQFDSLLTNAIRAVSARFDHETNRTLARTANFTQEFDTATTEILAACYPIESVTTFEFKTSESAGWQPIDPQPDYLVRNACVICLCSPFILHNSSFILPRVSYTGGYALPGTDPAPGQIPLPTDLEHTAIEQVAAWFMNRDKLGLKTIWPYHGSYQQFLNLDLLPSVQSTLKRHTRWSL